MFSPFAYNSSVSRTPATINPDNGPAALQGAEEAYKRARAHGIPLVTLDGLRRGCRRDAAAAPSVAKRDEIYRAAEAEFQRLAELPLNQVEPLRSNAEHNAIVVAAHRNPPKGFDASGFVSTLASRGISLTSNNSGQIIAMGGALNDTDRRLIKGHRDAILAALDVAEIL